MTAQPKVLFRCLSRRGRQSGSIVINTAIAMSLIVIALIGTELGYLFVMKRELQKTADLAAIAGASAVLPTQCGAANSAALANAAQNIVGFIPVVSCGRWDPTQGTERNFTAGLTAFNAVQVRIEGAPPSMLPFFPGSRTLSVEAIAAVTDPLAAFSVGSTLLRTGPSVLSDLLKGIGLDLTGTSLVGYDGLAQVKITPSGLLQALGVPVATDIGVGELNTLLAGRNVQVAQVLDAIVTLGGQSGLLGANTTLLNAINARVGASNLLVQLGSVAGGASGLFAEIVAPSAASALGVEVNALDLLYSSIGVATQKHAVAVNGLSALGLVNAKTVLIEPPSIAIGGVGATAYTAQLRTWVEIDTGNLPVIGSIARVKLPIMIDLVNGRGTLTEMCTPALRLPNGTERAAIAVTASIAKVCVGRPGADPTKENEIFSTSASCDQNLADEDLLKVGLLGVNLVSLRKHLKLDALPLQNSVTLAAGETGIVGNELLLGTTVKNITDALLATLLAESLDRGPVLSMAQRTTNAQSLWGTPACTTRACRVTRLTNVKATMESTTSGLGGFLGGLSSDVLALLNNTLALNVQGLLNGVGNLVGGLLTGLGNVLGAVLGSVIGGCNALIGSNDAACVADIANSLGGNSSAGGDSVPNAITALTGYLLNALKPILDGLGSNVLTPILHNLLGLRLGEIDVNLMTLNCQARAHLVY